MTELTPETVTDEQVDSFFENGGEIKPSEPEEVVESIAPEPEPKEEPKEEKKVNYGALHEERMRRKEATERAKALEAELEQYKRQATRQPEPTYDDDPIESVRRENQQIKQVLIAQAEQAKKQTEDFKYWEKVKESELAYKKDVPDFDDAVKHLADTRIEELKDLGFSDQEAAKVLSDEIRWISDKAYADEVNPAERFYNLAKRRGWKAKASEPIDNSADIKLDSIQKGMQTNRQLPPASKSVKQDLTFESLSDMKVDALSNIHGDTEFDKAWKKLFG